jgi:hypothetical protein
MHIDYFKFYELPKSKVDKLLQIRQQIDEKKREEAATLALLGGLKK